ncbi:MAG: AmmeMemoRadiSam system protein B [Nanobdellota archaeon]
MANWYPQNPEELKEILDEYLDIKENNKDEINGLVVPHAGYSFSGKIAGKAFSLLKNTNKKKAIILAPSHYSAFKGVKKISKIDTPLGKIKVSLDEYETTEYEHAIDNQIPFLQKLGFKEVLPLVLGDMDKEKIKKLAENISEKMKDHILIISTDLSHFEEYYTAKLIDNETIKTILSLDPDITKINACGLMPILTLLQICKIKNYTPKLIEYKNSGDITGDKTAVVGYVSMYF